MTTHSNYIIFELILNLGRRNEIIQSTFPISKWVWSRKCGHGHIISAFMAIDHTHLEIGNLDVYPASFSIARFKNIDPKFTSRLAVATCHLPGQLLKPGPSPK